MSLTIPAAFFPGGRRFRPSASPTTEFSDTFNRADAASLGTATVGGAWTEYTNGFTIVGNLARQENESTCAAFTPVLSSANMFAQVTVAAFTAGISSFIGPVVRAPATIGTDSAGTGAFYCIVVSGAGMNTFTIRRKEDASATVTILSQVTEAIAPGDVLRLEAENDALRAYRNGVLVTSYTGAVLTGQNRAGIRNDAGTGAVIDYDNFSAGALPTAVTPTTFSDTFNRADAASLGSSPTGGAWVESTDGFTIVGGAAQPENENTCTAFTPELTSADHYAEVVVDAFGAGVSSFIGPIVRAPATLGTTPATTGSYYVLTVSGTAMNLFAIRQKTNLSSATTVLVSSTTAIAPGDRLRLEADGGFLRAYLNGVLVVSTTGAVLTDQKRAGMYVDEAAGTVVQLEDFAAGQVSTSGGTDPDPPLDPAATELVVTAAELAALPTSGTAYTAMLGVADSTWPTPDMNNQDSFVSAMTIAAALVYARTGTSSYRTKVINVLAQLPDTPVTGRALAWGRQLGGYCVAADLVGYRDSAFVAWASSARTITLPGHSRWTSIKVCALDSLNNWGAWCLPSYLAASRYVGDATSTQQAINIFKGVLGNTSLYSAWRATSDYDPSWVVGNPSAANFHGPGINPVVGGTGLDGGPAEDAGRGPAYPVMDATSRQYCWEAVSGWMFTARLARYAGFTDVYTYQSSALKRAGLFLARFDGWPAQYGSSYPTAVSLNRVYNTTMGPLPPYGTGRQLGYTDWLNV